MDDELFFDGVSDDSWSIDGMSEDDSWNIDGVSDEDSWSADEMDDDDPWDMDSDDDMDFSFSSLDAADEEDGAAGPDLGNSWLNYEAMKADNYVIEPRERMEIEREWARNGIFGKIKDLLRDD